MDELVSAPVEDAPTAFISYSWDSVEHQQWVLALAERLQAEGGVRVVLDQWYLRPGFDRTHFMESNIVTCHFVLVICTPEYARKSNGRSGGVGYEASIITGQLAQQVLQNKFIPVLRAGDWGSRSQPSWLVSKIGVDFREGPYDEGEYEKLLRELHKSPVVPPPIGPKPSFPDPPRMPLSTPTNPRSRDSMGTLIPVLPNLVYIGARLAPVTESGLHVWSADMGRFERKFAIGSGRLAVLAQFTNEAIRGRHNVGGLVKAHVAYRNGPNEIRRLTGCWLNELTDYAEIRVDESRDLLIAVSNGDQVLAIGKRRVQINLSGEIIETDAEPLPVINEVIVLIRLTNADTGNVLFEGEYKLGLKPLSFVRS